MNDRVKLWRRRIGLVSSSMASLLFVSTVFIYERYATYPSLHNQEIVQHTRLLGAVWNAGLFGSMVLFVASLFGLGWGRWLGLILSLSTILYALMILGTWCGPFGCG
jgi:uncharacterized membrane protein